MHQISAAEFTARMEQIAAHVAMLEQQPDDPISRTAAELLAMCRELHAAGLERMLLLVQAGGQPCRPLLEQFAQDDLIRSLLFFYDLHPIALSERLAEAIANLRPVVESYGGSVSIADIRSNRVTLRLVIEAGSGPSPVAMLKKLLEQAVLVAAPDVEELRFDDRPAPSERIELPIINVG